MDHPWPTKIVISKKCAKISRIYSISIFRFFLQLINSVCVFLGEHLEWAWPVLQEGVQCEGERPACSVAADHTACCRGPALSWQATLNKVSLINRNTLKPSKPRIPLKILKYFIVNNKIISFIWVYIFYGRWIVFFLNELKLNLTFMWNKRAPLIEDNDPLTSLRSDSYGTESKAELKIAHKKCRSCDSRCVYPLF